MTMLEGMASWIAGAFPAMGASAALRATLLVVGAAAIARGVRGGARARHGLWSVTLVVVLALPWVGTALPRLPVVLPAWVAGEGAPPGTERRSDALPDPEASAVGAVGGDGTVVPAGLSAVPAPPMQRGPDLPGGAILALVWLAGALPVGGAFALGLLRAARVARQGSPALDPAWEASLAEASLRVGIRRFVRLRFTGSVATPMTGGLLRPYVLLPERARVWSSDRREMVLVHELVHVARADVLRQAAARLATALYWFHPLVWWAARRAALAREEACDETVVALGHRASTYARHLLELAEPDWLPLPALSRMDRPQLEKRLMAVLSPSAGRPRRWLAATTTLCAVGWAVSVAGVSPRLAEAPGTPIATGPELSAPSVEAVAGADAPVKASLPAPQAATCLAGGIHGNFNGTFSQARGDDRPEGVEVSGVLDGSRIVQTRFDDDAVLCMRAYGPVEFDESMTRVASIGDGGRLELEVHDPRGTQRLEMSAEGGRIETRWIVDGVQRTFDEEGQAWRDAALAVVGARWQIDRIRGQVRGPRGEISAIRGGESSIKAKLSSLAAELSNLEYARQATLDAETRGRLDEEVAALRRRLAAREEFLVRYEAERQARAVQGRERADDADRRAREYEEALAQYEAQARLRRIREVGDADRVAELRGRMEGPQAERRVQEIQTRLDVAERRLVELVRAVR